MPWGESTEMNLAEGMVVAEKFKLVRMIGKGGMGSVWAAEQIALDRPCAVKFIEGELANVAEAHERFKREAKAAAQLGQSPHVVQTYDHGVWQGKPYIAMELLNGRDLGKTLLVKEANGEKLTLIEIHDIMAQVCRALSKAHQAGIVHRDLKPDNIFLVNEEDGSGKALVKILDFGVAKATGQAIDGSNTKTGAMLGTPYYMSPEQAQGIKSVDARSDLWSLAVIVFQCVTGRLPFESEALGDLLVKIIVSPVPTMGSVYPEVTPELEEWWRKASERSVEKRFQTAKEFAESLNRAIASSTGGVTAVQDTRRSDQRVGGATAFMSSNTPGNIQGQQYTHALGMTPQPGAQSPFHSTPHPHMNTPHPGAGAYGPHATTGSGIGVFSAGEPATPPKKGPPLLVIGAFAALFIVGMGAGGVALYKSRSAAQPTPISATTTVPPPEASNVPPPKPADPPPVEAKPAEAKPAEAKPAEAKPAEPAAKPVIAAKPGAPKPTPGTPGVPTPKPAGPTPTKPAGGVAPGF